MSVIEYEKEGRISIIRFNDPPLNLGNKTTSQMMDRILTDIENDPEVRVVVLANSGKIFAAGSDLKEMSQHLDQGTYVDVKMVAEVRGRVRMSFLPVPTIAALDGSAYGGGFDWALACDMRIARPDVVLSHPEILLGTFPGSGSAFRLTRLIGYGRAFQHMMFAESMSAAQALEWAVLSAIAETGSAFEMAMNWAREIARRSPTATRALKQVMAEMYRPEQPF